MKNANNELLIQKQRIRKIKTQHDDSANINKSLLYQQRKKLHKQQISYATFADKKSDELFSLKPVDIEFVQSLTLKDDPKFKEIRHLLQKYNEQVLRYDQKSAPGLHLKTKVIDSMLKFMRLMFQAPDATAKKRILDVAYYWFKKNLEAENSTNKPRSKQSLQTQIRTILTQSNLVPKAIIDKQLPSQKQKQQLYHYYIKARTKYSQLNPPGVELQNFVTHKLGFANQDKKEENDPTASNLKSIEELREEKWKKRIIFKKPYIEQLNYNQIEQQYSGKPLEQPPSLIQPAQTSKDQPSTDPNQADKPTEPVDPNNPQAPVQPQNQAIQQQLDMGIPDENDPADDQPDEPQEQEEQKKKGKLDPLVKIFLRDRQKRIKTQGQVTAEKRYQGTQNWKLQQKRLDELNAQIMTQWAGNRSRFKSQLSRKIQSIRTFTSISKARQQSSLHNPRVQNTLNKIRLNQTLKQYGQYLHHQMRDNELNTQMSISVFDKKRVKTQVAIPPKTFSSILQDRKRIDQKSQYIDEIQNLKEKFAKYKLYTPLDSFQKAIMHPQQKQCTWAQLDKQSNVGIQLPRSQMISNPFIVTKKKKKKGKKKK